MCRKIDYRKIDEAALGRLRDIAGADDVLAAGLDDAEALEPYSHDEVAELRAEPEAVVRVTTTRQVSEIMKLAQEQLFPVTPRGAGQGLSGGAVPAKGGLVLSLEKMKRIIEIDHENLMVTTEPGVTTGDLHRAVEAEGLFYPPDPASLDSCTIGGNVAENAGGPRAVKYGVTNDYVCGLEVVLPSGQITELGGKVVKNVTGYSLIQLLLGSEGTLGIVTKIILRLIPLPKERVDLLVPFEDIGAAATSVAEIISSKIVPAALEFMERDSLLAVEKLTEKEVPFRDYAAHLLVTLDGNDRQMLDAECERIGEICMANRAADVLVADDQRTRDRLWKTRRLIIEALQNLSPEHIMDTQDVVVPRTEIPELLDRIREVAQKYDLRVISFGHAGDGNVHVSIIKDVPEEVWKERGPKAAEEIYRIAVSLGGAVTGEHGVGLTRRRFLSLGLDQEQIGLMKGIKEAFDPHCILNPGKIFA